MNYPVAEDGTVLYNHGIAVPEERKVDTVDVEGEVSRELLEQIAADMSAVLQRVGFGLEWDGTWEGSLTNFEKVGEFMEAMDQQVLHDPQFPDGESNTDEKGLRPIAKLRIDLIREEFDELRTAIVDDDIVGIADALTDILYVVYGAGHAFGIDLDACFEEVHASNMTKLGPDGKAIKNENGKVMKPATYRPPNLAAILGVLQE